MYVQECKECVLFAECAKCTDCADCTLGAEEWHVIFQGADEYETSTPLKHLLQESSDCVLATHMNGHPLSLDHGYPIRVVLPGIAGARNVKWLESIVSCSYFSLESDSQLSYGVEM